VERFHALELVGEVDQPAAAEEEAVRQLVAEQEAAGQPGGKQGWDRPHQVAILTAARLVLGPSQLLPRSLYRLVLANAGCTAGWPARQALSCRLPSTSRQAGPSMEGGRHTVHGG